MAIVFTYMLIAAALAAVVWGMWWGLSSLGSPERLALAGRAAPQVRQSGVSHAFPQPVDLALPRYPRAIAICRLSDGAEIGDCKGPDHAGKCPKVLADGTVPCAGALLSLPRPIRGSAEWHIPHGYSSCLVGSYDVYRQPVAPG
jgi:hypothetical protein